MAAPDRLMAAARPPLARAWRLLVSPPASGAENMALDAALLERARTSGEAVFRLYAWSRPTLSLGRNQLAHGRYDERAAAELGIDIVRRPTGGRALLHHREITYSVTAPAGDVSHRAAYGRINALLVDALRRLGLDARLAVVGGDGERAATAARPPDDTPCFVGPSEGEIVLGGRKLVGSAQWREFGALLQHGSILIHDDQPLIARIAVRPVPPVPPPATLAEALPRVPSFDDLGRMATAAIRDVEGVASEPLEIDAPLRARARELAAWYSDPAWTWRR